MITKVESALPSALPIPALGLAGNALYLHGAWTDQAGTPLLYGYKVINNGAAIEMTGCEMVNVTNFGGPYAFHPGGANVLRCDGSVGFLRESVTPQALMAFVTRSGDSVSPPDF